MWRGGLGLRFHTPLIEPDVHAKIEKPFHVFRSPKLGSEGDDS